MRRIRIELASIHIITGVYFIIGILKTQSDLIAKQNPGTLCQFYHATQLS